MAVADRHPDPEQLAEYVDGVLSPAEREKIQQHLAICGECREIVSETFEIVADEPLADPASNPATAPVSTPAALPAPVVLPFPPRRWVRGVVTAAALAAVIALAIVIVRPGWLGVGSAGADRQELIAALAKEPTRLGEGRLTGDLPYVPPTPQVRTASPLERRPSADVQIAVARIEQRARENPARVDDRTLGVAYLARDAVDLAIHTLVQAAAGHPDAAQVHSDLAAAYIVRATRTGRADDWSGALTAADAAIDRDATLVEAYFNRAVSLEGLGRSADAQQAWNDYLARESNGAWRDEATRRLERLRNRAQ